MKEIFLEAVELPEETARAAFLDRACGGDTGLRARVEELLQSHDPAGSFLGTPAAVIPDPDHAATRSFSPDADHAATRTGEGTSRIDDEIPLGFLSSSTRPDSLGRIGHYEVLQVLGQGGFGIVFRAFDDVLHRVVAVKVLSPQMASTSPARKRFLREARTSGAIRHEHVVQVHEVGEEPLPYLVMEFIPGETLQQRLDRIGPIEPAEVVRIGRQIAEGLAAAHDTDLIHRDIKPGNILLEGSQQKVKITDFGLARAADDASISQSGIIAGTPMYMAPEQAKGEKLDQRADLFSLGSVLYQMAAGRPPFRANSTVAVLKRVAEDTPRDIREIIPETPQWLCDIIAKLHAKNPDERFQSAREVSEVLADCEAQLKENAKLKDFSRIPKSNRSAVKTSGRRRWAAAALLLVPALVLAVTESSGVTQLLRGQAAFDPIMPVGDPVPVVVAKTDTAVPVAKQEPLPTFTNSIGMEFVIVPKGKSWLGGGKDKLGDKDVVIPADFYLGKYEVTQEEWEKVMGENPSHFSRTGEGKDAVKDIPDANLKRFPVERVSWDACQVFVEKLNRLEKETGWVYRLPTEKEWEYACRGGPMSDKLDGAFDFYFAKPTNTLIPEQANFGLEKGLNRTCKVGTYESNRLGLFDMHGNVWEWCDDTVKDDNGATARVPRGGSWYSESTEQCRAAGRHVYPPSNRYADRGLRLARVRVGAPSSAVKTPPVASQTPLPPTFKNGIGMEFVIVPKGKAWLGGGKDKLGDKEVVIPADFYLGKYEVTQEEWEKVMGENPSWFSRVGGGADNVKGTADADLKRFPVDQVSWEACQLFVEKLSRLEKETGWVYRLPKEAEWEYACRGGPMSDKLNSAFDFYFATPTNTLLPGQANFNSGTFDTVIGLKRNGKVGSYEPNALGLFDLHGYLWEWCDDTVIAADGASHRVRRGGCWYYPAEGCRAAIRGTDPPSHQVSNLGLRLARVPSGAPAPETKTPPSAVAPFTDADVKRIAALPAEQQVEEVRKELIRRNSGFDGKVEHKIEDGVVTEFKIVTDHVTDIAPIRAFNALRVLKCNGTWTGWPKGLLEDLTPLAGMKLANLTSLDLACTKVTDAGMVHFKDCNRLTELVLECTQVGDAGVACFKDCKNLTRLNLAGTSVSDAGLAPFEGCDGLLTLALWDTRVGDAGLAHFKGSMKLERLYMGRTQVGDVGLAQFKSMPLRGLSIDATAITDLTPLEGLAVEDFRLTPKNITKGLNTLRDMKSLNTIAVDLGQNLPAVEFWQRYDKGEFGFAPLTDADVKRIAALPAAEQVEEVRKELMRRNPGFDGKVGHKIEEGVVTELRINTDKVTDISPIRVFNALRVLNLGGTATEGRPNGRLANLTPLREMKLSGLTMLSLANTPIDDAGLAHFKDCKSLEILWLNCTPVTNAGVGLFKSCTALKSLTLNNTRVDDAGLVHFKDCKGLTGIDLGGLAITDTGLALFKDCKDLTHLVLYETRVTNAGLAQFKDCKDLTFLHLKQTSIGDAGLAHFKDCKKLTWVDVAETEITDAGLAHLKGMPLKALLVYNTRISDLTPLQGMPLEDIRLTPKNITRGLDILRDMKSLKTIGIEWQRTWPAAEFWERYDKGEFKE